MQTSIKSSVRLQQAKSEERDEKKKEKEYRAANETHDRDLNLSSKIHNEKAHRSERDRESKRDWEKKGTKEGNTKK